MYLICTLPMTSDVAHLFICIFAVCISSVLRGLFRFLAQSLTGLFSYGVLIVCICGTPVLYQTGDSQRFSPSLWLVF